MLRESVVVLLLALGAFAVSNDTMCELKGEKGVKVCTMYTKYIATGQSSLITKWFTVIDVETFQTV